MPIFRLCSDILTNPVRSRYPQVRGRQLGDVERRDLAEAFNRVVVEFLG